MERVGFLSFGREVSCGIGGVSAVIRYGCFGMADYFKDTRCLSSSNGIARLDKASSSSFDHFEPGSGAWEFPGLYLGACLETI